MDEQETKRSVIWVGEHAFKEYNQLNTSTLNLYNHFVLRYTRYDKTEINTSIYYLDEYTYLPEENYSKKALSISLVNWLKDKGIAFQEGIIIGDSSEILMQSFVDASTFSIPHESNKEEILFDAVYQLDSSYSKDWVNLSGFSVLFLKESIPFSDILQEAEQTKNEAYNNYNSVLYVAHNPFSINGFLFYYQDGLEEIMKSMQSIQKLN